MKTIRFSRVVAVHLTPGDYWVRVFGWGISWRDTARYRLTFSERNGFAKHWMLGRWSVCLLRKR